MVAVTSVMRAHRTLLARVETALRAYDLSFSLPQTTSHDVQYHVPPDYPR